MYSNKKKAGITGGVAAVLILTIAALTPAIQSARTITADATAEFSSHCFQGAINGAAITSETTSVTISGQSDMNPGDGSRNQLTVSNLGCADFYVSVPSLKVSGDMALETELVQTAYTYDAGGLITGVEDAPFATDGTDRVLVRAFESVDLTLLTTAVPSDDPADFHSKSAAVTATVQIEEAAADSSGETVPSEA